MCLVTFARANVTNEERYSYHDAVSVYSTEYAKVFGHPTKWLGAVLPNLDAVRRPCCEALTGSFTVLCVPCEMKRLPGHPQVRKIALEVPPRGTCIQHPTDA